MSFLADPTGTSATVYDFICLFTHDLKRKQKRWQDGKLKYHTFNKKVMVYDDHGNFVGESHWQEDGNLEDGCELALERGGAIVQVAECVGSRSQDLTELVEKRVKDVEMRRASKAARGLHEAASAPSNSRTTRTSPSHHFRQRTLTSLVRSPGPIGRSVVPTISPYESRIAERSVYMVTSSTSSTSKRKRSFSPPSKMGHAKALFGTQLSLSATPLSLPQVRGKALCQKSSNVATPKLPHTHGQPESIVPIAVPSPCTRAEHKDQSASNVHQIAKGTATSIGDARRQVVTGDWSLTERAAGGLPGILLGDLRLQEKESYDLNSSQREPYTPEHSSMQPSKREYSSPQGSDGSRKRLHRDGDNTISCMNEGLVSPPKSEDAINRTKDELFSLRALDDAGSHTFPGQSVKSLKRANASKTRAEPIDTLGNCTRSEHLRTKPLSRPTAPTAMPTSGSYPEPKARPGDRGDERRTELRIRPRQKRGLLMVSEKKGEAVAKSRKSRGCKPSGIADLSKSFPQLNKQQLSATSQLLGNQDIYDLPLSANGPKKRNIEHIDAQAKQESIDPEEADRCFEEWLLTGGMSADDDPCSPQPSCLMKTRRHRPDTEKTGRHDCIGAQDTEEDATHLQSARSIEVKAAIGPRITRLARKSIKSREIIGFVPAEGLGLNMPFANRCSNSTLFPPPAPALEDVLETAQIKSGAERLTRASFLSGLEDSIEQPDYVAKASSVTESSSTVHETVALGRANTSTMPGQKGCMAIDCSVHTIAPRDSSLPQPHPPFHAGESERPISPISHSTKSQRGNEHLIEKAGMMLGDMQSPQVQPGQGELIPIEDEPNSALGGTVRLESYRATKDTSLVLSRPQTTGKDKTIHGTEAFEDNQQSCGPKDAKSLIPSNSRISTDVNISLSGVLPVLQCTMGSIDSTAKRGIEEGSLQAARSCNHAYPTSAGEFRTPTVRAIEETKMQDAGAPRQISNPATRGKKAAAKKDAAGMAPRTLVQLDPPRPVLIRKMPVPVSRPPIQGQSIPVGGFTAASGGAWSKHAQDLLGMSRPG